MIPSSSINPRAILRIARWELSRGTAEIDRRLVISSVIALLILGGGLALGAPTGIDTESEIYRVGVSSQNSYHPVVMSSDSFTAVEDANIETLREGRIEVLIDNRSIKYRETPKSRAALDSFRRSVLAYNDRLMIAERNLSAAYPVAVSIEYNPQSQIDGNQGGTGGNNGSGTPTNNSSPNETRNPGDFGGNRTRDGGSFSLPENFGGGFIGGPGGGLITGSSEGPPSSISPPFPFEALLFAFLFIIPMNFVIQVYGASILKERLNRRGELLLSAPVSPVDIVAGKTLPYLGGIVAITAVVSWGIGAGLYSLFAIVPLGILFLGATFLAAMFARSYKELTFLTVAISTAITVYAFVPAIFSSFAPIALISPLTVVVRELALQEITVVEFSFSAVPVLTSASMLFILGLGVYRAEDMFAQRPIRAKALSTVARYITGPRSVALIALFTLPFVFLAELLAVAGLFSIPALRSVYLLLLAIVIIEELAKALPLYAGFSHNRLVRTTRGVLIAGLASGVGFFVGEKSLLTVQLLGLTAVSETPLLLETGATSLGLPPAVLLMLPLVLHSLTAVVMSIGASRSRRMFFISLGLAIAIHFGYNRYLLEVTNGF